MAESHLKPMPISGRPSHQSEGGGRVWGWVFLSGLAHVALIAFLLIMPFLPSKAPNYPVISVDLVGGEKLGGGAGTALVPEPKAKAPAEAAPEVKTKKESKKAKETPPVRPNPAELKETKKKLTEKAAMAEQLALTKAKKEQEEKRRLAEEAEAEKAREVREKIAKLRERRIEEAIASRRALVEEQQKQQQLQQQKTAPATSSVVGDKPGAAAPGVGGTGGGVVKSAEYLRYYNDMIGRIKNSWTWVGRRTDLRVTVHFGIEDNGEIAGLKLGGTSGDRSYDDSVIRAIRKVNPLPPPPETYRKEFKDVELTFTPKDLAS